MGPMIELNIYLLLSVIWTLKDVSVYGFTYVYGCVTWEGAMLTGY